MQTMENSLFTRSRICILSTIFVMLPICIIRNTFQNTGLLLRSV